jgi:hypothetical protein
MWGGGTVVGSKARAAILGVLKGLLGGSAVKYVAGEYVGIPRDFVIKDILSREGGVLLVKTCAPITKRRCGGG